MLGKWMTAVGQMDNGRLTNGQRPLDKWMTAVGQMDGR